LAPQKRTGNNEALSEIGESSQVEPLALAGLLMGNIADGVTTPSEPIAGEALTHLW
jgi:hypothetical protein